MTNLNRYHITLDLIGDGFNDELLECTDWWESMLVLDDPERVITVTVVKTPIKEDNA